MQQSTFAASRRAHNGQHLSLPHLEGQVFKDHKLRTSRAIHLAKLLNPQDVCCGNWMQSGIPPLLFRAFNGAQPFVQARVAVASPGHRKLALAGKGSVAESVHWLRCFPALKTIVLESEQ